MTDKERQILEMQCPSTRRALERSPDLDLEWFNRPIPKEAQVVKEDGSVDLNIREISASELAIETSIRHNRGARFEDARTSYLMSKASEGKIHPKLIPHIETKHVMPDAEKRNRAIEAFMKSRTVDAIKNMFMKLMAGIKKEPSYAEKIAEGMRKMNEE